jgi:hypothetical protein
MLNVRRKCIQYSVDSIQLMQNICIPYHVADTIFWMPPGTVILRTLIVQLQGFRHSGLPSLTLHRCYKSDLRAADLTRSKARER